MRRASLFLTLMVLAALLLAACGGQETSTSVPSTNVPPVTAESTATEEPAGTATGEATAETTTTPAVPVTGEDSLARVSNLIGTSVCGLGGDQLGTVQDLVLDFDQTMVTYLVVDASGRNVAVPWTSMTLPAGGTGTTDQQNCLSLMVDDDTFNNAPDFDESTMPAQGQTAAGWDQSLSGYWQGGGTGSTGTGTGSETSTPAAGETSATAVPVTTATTEAGTGTGTGSGQGQGAQQMQGMILATDVLGAPVTISPQGNDQQGGTGTGTGTGTTSTNTPEAGATAAATDAGTGTGAETGTGTQGTVEDIILDTTSGDLQYLVISTGGQENWIPIPVGFLRWDATSNGFILMINENALQNAPAFAPDQFPDTSTSGWDQEWSDFWQNNAGTGTDSGSGTGTGSETATPTP